MAALSTVVVGFDGTDQGHDALVLAQALAGPGSRLVVCCVHPPDPPLLEPVDRELSTEAEAHLRLRAARAALGDDPRAAYVTRQAFSAAGGLHEEAAAQEADLLVVGSSHRGALGRVLAGSVTRQALQAAPCAVAVAPRGLHDAPPAPPRLIGVAFDGGPEARAALRTAAALARELGAELRLLAVADLATSGFGWAVGAPLHALREAEQANLRRGLDAAIAGLEGVTASAEVLEGRASDRLVAASAALDLLVLGSRNYGPVRRALLGTVSGRVADEAACPVLVVPRAGDDDTAPPPVSS